MSAWQPKIPHFGNTIEYQAAEEAEPSEAPQIVYVPCDDPAPWWKWWQR